MKTLPNILPSRMIKCGIQYNCISDSIMYVLQLIKLLDDNIGKKMRLNQKISQQLIQKTMDVYKQFSKRFFSKKSINCMKKNCNMKKNIPELTKLIKSLEIFINGHKAISKGYKLKPIVKKYETNLEPFIKFIEKYIDVIKVLHKIVIDIDKKYNKFF
jgi:hypothetical protein